MIPQYPSPQQIGSRHVCNLFDGPVVVQEKVDGSQIGFGLDSAGNLRVRSRGALLNLVSPDKMFAAAIAQIRARENKLTLGWTYRGEYLARPKHNVLNYDRVPAGNIALFDIQNAEGEFIGPVGIAAQSAALGFDSVPVIYEGVTTAESLRGFLERVSFLGGAKVEGVVVKNYALSAAQPDGWSAKFVSEEFKESHAHTPRPKGQDVPIEDQLLHTYKTQARWAKALQHLREAGKIIDSPKDIGLIVREVQADLDKECREEISALLYAHFQSKLVSGVVDGLALWYKDLLLKDSFKSDDPG